MNIDIVNKQVSAKQPTLTERQVVLINKFYWRKVYDHFYSYSERPLDIQNVCVFYNDAYLIKKYIKYYVRKIRRTLISKKFKEGSLKRLSYIEAYKKILRDVWRLRKLHKFTN